MVVSRAAIADAVQAYIQVRLKGNKRCFVLPPDRRPPGAAGMKKPVVELLQALYVHPDSGSFWEEHCDNYCKEAGFEPLGIESPSTNTYVALRLFLVVYVDDFKLSGPAENLAKG